MAPGPSESLSPAAVAAAVFTALLGPEFAQELAAYTIVLLGWFGGLCVGLVRLPDEAPWSGWPARLAFVGGTLAASVCTSVALASIIAASIQAWVPGVTRADLKDWLFLVSAAIPAIGHDWPRIARWGIRWAGAKLESRANRGQQ